MAGASFAQVLDRLIDDRPPRGAGPGITTSPLGGVSFADRRRYRAAFSSALAQPRLGRALSARHRAALDVLRSAGAADLADDFLIPELRAAFRHLARAAHPDMHPHAGEAERQRLASQFREIREAYQILANGARFDVADRPS